MNSAHAISLYQSPIQSSQIPARAESPHSLPSPPLSRLKGVGFLRACLLAELPSSAFLLSCERDARAPSTRNAGNAGVPPAMPNRARKTYPFKPLVKAGEDRGEGGSESCAFTNFGGAVGIRPEGVGLSTAVSCELWCGDWYNTNRGDTVYKNKRN